MEVQQYVNQQKDNPIFQALAVGVIGLVAMGIANMGSSSETGWENVWIVLITFMLFFSIMNTVISLASDNQVQYFWKSITCFFALMAFMILMAYVISSVSFYEAGFFRWMIVVVVFGYLVFFSIVMAMQRIIKYAQRQDKKFRNEE